MSPARSLRGTFRFPVASTTYAPLRRPTRTRLGQPTARRRRDRRPIGSDRLARLRGGRSLGSSRLQSVLVLSALLTSGVSMACSPPRPARGGTGFARPPTFPAKCPVPLGLVLPLSPPLDQRGDASPGEHEHQQGDGRRRDEQVCEGHCGWTIRPLRRLVVDQNRSIGEPPRLRPGSTRQGSLALFD